MADLSEGLGIVTAWEAVSLASNRHCSGFLARVHAPVLHQMRRYALKVDELCQVFGLEHNSSANSVQLPDYGQTRSWPGSAGRRFSMSSLPTIRERTDLCVGPSCAVYLCASALRNDTGGVPSRTENPDFGQCAGLPNRLFCFAWLWVSPCTTFRMKRNLLLLSWAAASYASAQVAADAVKKDGISVHTVERGSMSIFAPASGTLTSAQPARAILHFDGDERNCEEGRSARLVVGDNSRPLAGRVARRMDTGDCEVEFVEKLPEAAVAGIKIGGLIVSREMRDVVFFGRPADSKANSTSTIFVLDGSSSARRVTVRYGAMSGPLIQVLDGLAPGDKVIVTDMSKYSHLARVKLVE